MTAMTEPTGTPGRLLRRQARVTAAARTEVTATRRLDTTARSSRTDAEFHRLRTTEMAVVAVTKRRWRR